MRDLLWYQGPKDAVTGKCAPFRAPHTDDELADWLERLWGFSFPRKAVCPGHTAPFDALAEAYFARVPVSVWLASRGFGGKTTALAALSLLELISFYDVTLLGGSGEQTARVHDTTRRAWSYSQQVVPCFACGHPFTPFSDSERCYACGKELDREQEVMLLKAPLELLEDEPASSRTRSKAQCTMVALTASTRSVRGPHPQRMRMDEVDEMGLEIVDAAMGQTMSSHKGQPVQTVFASTHHYEAGTMTEILKRAKANGWPIREWCYKETMFSPDNPGSWLRPETVEQKRSEVTSRQWRVEYDLETPEEGGLLFKKETIDKLFVDGPTIDDRLNVKFEIEPSDEDAEYATGADWAKRKDMSVVCTLRTDEEPARITAWARYFMQSWPWVIQQFNDRVEAYPGKAAHDATGLGDVVHDYLSVESEGLKMVGPAREELFLGLEYAVENGAIGELPRIASLIDVLRTVRGQDLHGGGHPPDELVALAMAIRAAGLTPSSRPKKRRGRMLRPRHF